MKTNKCPECGNMKLKQVGTEIICPECGLVLEDAPLQQGFISEPVKKHAQSSYISTAGSKQVDGKIYKATWLLSTREKNIKSGMRKIDMAASRLRMPEFVSKEAKIIYKQAMQADLAVGRNNQAIALASVYAACNIHDLPKTALEVTAYTGTSKTQLLRACKLIKTELGLKINHVDPADLVQRFATRLKLRPDTIKVTNDILDKIKGTKVTQGRKPETIVAAALYLASQRNEDKRTQRDIANAVGVIEVTIRKRAKEIKQRLF
ncbi:MAG: transcription initiation factor IIB family protein [Nanoarchaeota archaeon]|nr:transcription initiation factor IIB family protein [Nanoarchaeota archaeon]